MDSVLLHNVNCYLIRAAFWTVLLIGTVDAAISFLRVQDLNEGLFGAAMADNLKLSDFRGVYIHLPLIALGFAIATVTRTLGFIWLALLVVVAEVLIVVGRFVFSYEQTFMADLVRFWYAALFLFASAYTLFEDGHVRVDVFYAGFGETTKGYANAWGTVLFGISLCWVILIIGMENKASIIVSPILYFESAQEGFGMMVKYMMAGFLGVFASTMMIQFVSFLFESVADYRDEPGRRERAAEIAH
ncbi:MAG: TRAP transporter small permease subunit [Pseudomonadota bacterium]